MNSCIFLLAFVCAAQAQYYSWSSTYSCNDCFGPQMCFGSSDKLPLNCSNCLHNTCEKFLEIQTFATTGINCIQHAWQDPKQCQAICPPWTYFDTLRAWRCSLCLAPCVGKLINDDVGQCSVEKVVDTANDACVSETAGQCGTCFRANRCFTKQDLKNFGGICKGYIDLKCPDAFNITCVRKAFTDPCSTCPNNDQVEGRFEACSLCLEQCNAKKQCVQGCKQNLYKYPADISCPYCRSFCKANPLNTNCEALNCNCKTCDACYQTCSAMPGQFNIFNPCQCLNKEEDAPVVNVLQGRIFGGAETCDEDWPWIAYIYELRKGPIVGGLCGGSLFNNKWIITAAHCFGTRDPALYGVILGERKVTYQSGREIFRKVERIVAHPFFDTITYNFDVALIEMNKEVNFNKYIMPIAIAAPGTRTDNTDSPSLAGKLCTTLGWGLTSSSKGSRSNTLVQLSLRILPRILCTQYTLSGYEQGRTFEGDPKFCAGAIKGEDSCRGDSGGPLFCLQADGTYILHGITSYGTAQCGLRRKPGVYTKVADVSGWINACATGNHCTI